MEKLMDKYIVVGHWVIRDFEKEVNRHIRLGYKPIGNLIISPD